MAAKVVFGDHAPVIVPGGELLGQFRRTGTGSTSAPQSEKRKRRRTLAGRLSERDFLAEVRREWAHSFPALPAQRACNRRVRWLIRVKGLRNGSKGSLRAQHW